MADIYEPKKDVYTILKTVSSSVTVFQNRPEIIKDLPCFTYYILENRPTITIEKEIGYQDIRIVIDIWATTSKESGTLLKALESTMRTNGYMLSSTMDITDPTGYSHITTEFNFIK